MADMDEPGDVHSGRSLYIFGRDVSKIPCFRESMMYGIVTGLGMGVLGFMCTSQPRKGSHIAVGSFMITTMSYWVYCRYQWSKQKFLVSQIQEGMRRRALYEGTDKDREILSKIKEDEA